MPKRGKNRTFVVHKVLEKKVEKGINFYLIKWKGYIHGNLRAILILI